MTSGFGNKLPVFFQGSAGEALTIPVPIAQGGTGATSFLAAGLPTLAANNTWANAVASQGTLATWTPAAYLALPASTENPDINFNLARTVQFATGAIALQRAVRFQPPTYDAVSASVIANAVTVAVGGPPIATGNITITNGWSQTWGTPVAISTSSMVNAVGLFGAGKVGYITRDTTNNIEGFYQINGTSTGVIFGAATNHTVGLYTSNVLRAAFNVQGKATFTPGTVTSSAAADFVITPAADTTIPASTESNVLRVDGATNSWAAGALTLQRDVYLRSQTIAFAGASIVADAVTLGIEGPPTLGASATFTKKWAIACGTPATTAGSISAMGIGAWGAGKTSLTLMNTSNSIEAAFDVTTGLAQIGTYTAHALNIFTNNSTQAACNIEGKWALTPHNVLGGVTTPDWKLTPAPNTGITASTECSVFNIATATRTWADGTVVTQRDNLFAAMTYAKTTTSTAFTTAATVAITDAPQAAAGVTITAAYSLWCQAGKAQFDGGAGFGLRADFKSYTVGTLPAAGAAGGQVYVSDAAVAPCIAFSNGTNWKRCDNAATTVV